MALSRAEIQQRYRERKKNTNGEAYMQKERNRKHKSYVPVADLNERELEKRRKDNNKRVKRHYEKKKALKVHPPSHQGNQGPSTRQSDNFIVFSFPFHKRGHSIGVRKRKHATYMKLKRKVENLEDTNLKLIRKKRSLEKRIERFIKKSSKVSKINTPEAQSVPLLRETMFNFD
jgi:hypothetical protein